MAGGLLARYAAAGARTGVVTATWAPGTVRAAELADAVRTLGAGEPRLLGYADARVPESAPDEVRFCDAPLDAAVGRLVSHIREFRPDTVVTHDGYGNATGHPDHVHTHRLAVLAVHAAGLDGLFPDAGEPWQPGALYLATHPRSFLATLADELGARKGLFGVPDEQVTAAVDVGPWLDRKIAALLCHRSEVARGALPGQVERMSREPREKLFSTEWYVRHWPTPAPTPAPGWGPPELAL
ncbi:PIG-L family deacetylase [Streptomyces sp. J2-1]|nr:PIG-L family deacetylase [Streptomyces corallincola]